MATAGLIHYVLNLLHVTVHIRDVCVFLAPVFSGLTSISTFLLTRELWNQGAGLLAACFIAIVPGYISRSVAGSFDNEGIAIFALQFTYYLWVRRRRRRRLCCCSYCSRVVTNKWCWFGFLFFVFSSREAPPIEYYLTTRRKICIVASDRSATPLAVGVVLVLEFQSVGVFFPRGIFFFFFLT